MNQQPRKPMGMNDSVHALLTAAVGCYLGFIAYKVLAQSGDMAAWLSIVLGAFFGLAAICVLAYAVVIWRNARKKAAQCESGADKEPQEDASQTKRPE